MTFFATRSSTLPRSSHDPWRRKILLALGLVALLSYTALVGGGLYLAHGSQTGFARQALENLGRVLEGHARSTVEKVDTILLATQLQLNADIAGRAPDRRAINPTLARYLSLIAAESQSLRVADASGRFIHDASGKLFAARIDDRDYFRQNRDEPGGSLVISEPLFARITHNWVITLSRRLETPAGEFSGLVQAAVRADYFQAFFASLRLGAGQSVTLIDSERRLIARYPAAPEMLGQPLASEPLTAMIASGEQQTSYTTRSAVDGIERLYVVRRVADYPLYVLVGHAEADYLANWHRQLFWSLLSIAVLGVVLSGWIIVWLRTYDRAREIAQGMTRAYETTFRRSRALLDSLPDPAWLSDRRHRLIAVNDAFAGLAGKPAESLLGHTIDQVWPAEAAQPLAELDAAVLAQQCQQKRVDSQAFIGGKLRHFEYIATPVFDDAGELAGIAGVARDITQLHADQERIRHLAEHDLLTDLPNRVLLADHMASALAETLGAQAQIALLFIDLDHFKNVNDTLGHEVGDQLLLQAARRLAENLDERDTISRQGGDEFAILIRGYGSPARLAVIAQRLNDALAQPFVVAGHELRVGASIGISSYPQDGQDIGALLKNADTAMYQAKAAGGGTYRFFTPDMNARISERVTLENSLRQALHDNQIHVHYQPQVDMAEGRLIGFEALVRWHHPVQGEIPPTRFIPIAEESNLINQIGSRVLHEACRQNRAWQDMGLPPVVIAVNLSAVQLRQPELAGHIAAVLADTGLDARWLELEITESAFVRDTERIVEVLQELRGLGIKLSVDDFGTGYSSLGYLKRLPFDRIKIDQSFVRDLPDNGDDIAIVRAIIGIAGSLQKEVIAEGVEQPQQIDFLLAQGCRLMQGYHFGRPADGAQAEALLRRLGDGGRIPD